MTAVSPAVVNVQSQRARRGAEGMQGLPVGSPMAPGFQGSELGSGVIIDKGKGYVVTNYHVIKDADRIITRLLNSVRFAGGTPKPSIATPVATIDRPEPQAPDFTYAPPGQLLPNTGFRRQSGRSDDTNEEVISARITEYEKKTAAVAEHYKKYDKVVYIVGEGTVDEIFDFLCKEIDARLVA